MKMIQGKYMIIFLLFLFPIFLYSFQINNPLAQLSSTTLTPFNCATSQPFRFMKSNAKIFDWKLNLSSKDLAQNDKQNKKKVTKKTETKRINIANRLTISRVIAIPIFIFSFIKNQVMNFLFQDKNYFN